MNGFKLFVFILAIGVIASTSFADIYEWTDENGVKHYSNYAPPVKSRVLMKTKEEPYDEAADRARVEAERQERLAMDRLEIVQREAELELRELEAERRLAEAERVAQAALQEADYYREAAATNSQIIYRSSGFWCPDNRFDCYRPIYGRWYPPKELRRSYPKKIQRLSPYQRYLYVKKHYGPDKNEYGPRERDKTRYRTKGHYSRHNLKPQGAGTYATVRLGSGGGRYGGRDSISPGRSALARRR